MWHRTVHKAIVTNIIDIVQTLLYYIQDAFIPKADPEIEIRTTMSALDEYLNEFSTGQWDPEEEVSDSCGRERLANVVWDSARLHAAETLDPSLTAALENLLDKYLHVLYPGVLDYPNDSQEAEKYIGSQLTVSSINAVQIVREALVWAWLKEDGESDTANIKAKTKWWDEVLAEVMAAQPTD